MLLESLAHRREPTRYRSSPEHRRHGRQFQQSLFDPTVLGPYPGSKINTPHDDVDLPDPLRKSHLATDSSITLNTPESVLFAANGTCVLDPEGKVGHLRANMYVAPGGIFGPVTPQVSIGQLFWDQDLIDEVDATHPDNTNLTPITRNVDDDLFLEEGVDTTSDPVINYVKFGDDI
ncbi:uncharacterized protein N7446_012722 [Penicillium canescens]|uniref:Uncharacterized protein n=1 Tax=Penicillium canescens TaxID=5083 RepID=A0AAD6HXP1_PENCN|nr:uncharacterized protein N7446_012722 [Penicillium canescens]KAJ6022369.1 hypothetical protein N7460_012764 [Penicillium canescens]KAJ6041656.1 hypothetical protein N7446_012722 [Penicillium canescens]